MTVVRRLTAVGTIVGLAAALLAPTSGANPDAATPKTSSNLPMISRPTRPTRISPATWPSLASPTIRWSLTRPKRYSPRSSGAATQAEADARLRERRRKGGLDACS